jgi:DNA-binding NtrC family response regulator
VAHFLDRARTDHNLPRKRIDEPALVRLAGHDYPGNVRELGNLIERLVILTPGDTIDRAAVELCLPAPRAGATATLPSRGSLRETMLELERRVVLQALESHRWRMTATAADLGLERSHLYKKLKTLGIERPSE